MIRNSRIVDVALSLLLTMLLGPAWTFGDTRAPVVIDARDQAAKPSPLPLPVGGKSPDGHVLSANTSYLTLDGKPWFPVMGEFHYSRYSDADWEQEILKMKAGGIQIISTYVFWIHHEEIEGQFDWTGQRNLRRFVELCGKNGLYVWIRIGPWDHGEVRNGGLPDWLIQKTPTRESNPIYLAAVSRFFDQIGKQVEGKLWKDGGPIIGIQLENEYSARGPRKGADHILKLRELARDAGMDAPFYTITGWDNAVIPSRDVLPVFGGYADGFWWRSLEDLPPNPNYFFTRIRSEENVDDDLHSKRPDIDAVNLGYPFLTAEMGGGMELSYHRRPLLSASDTAAMEIVKLGSGVVLYGYYMFHGGTNPEGKESTLQESQATGYPNDVPVKSYDFQAPIGEYGQMNESFRTLKTLNLFLGDYGSSLAPMASYFPKQMPASKRDTETPRLAARLQDGHGYLFLNNYQRTYKMPDQKNLQVRLEFSSGAVDVPRMPVNVPSGTYAIWPINLDLGGTRLRYATAQPLCQLDDPHTIVFFALPGISPEFALEESPGAKIESVHGQISRDRGIAYVDAIEPGAQVAIRIQQQNGDSVNIVVLSQEQALNIWKAKVAGRDRLILSPAQLYFSQDRVHLSAGDSSRLKAGFFPALEHLPADFVSEGEDGIFKLYAAHVRTATRVPAEVEKTSQAGADPPPRMGKEMMGKAVVLAPEDSEYDTAASWAILAPCGVAGGSKDFLRIVYEGDVARFYVDRKFLADNFYNGMPWLIGLDKVPCGQRDRLKLKILPLRNEAPIYLPAGARPSPSATGQVVELKELQVLPQYEMILDANP